jgi:hypothetical protein
MPGLCLIGFLRCFAEPIRKFVHKKINLHLGATPGKSVTSFEKHDQMIPLLDTVEFIGCEMLPLIVEFGSNLLPSSSQNIVKHAFYLSLISIRFRSSEATNGSDVYIEHVRRRHPSRPGLNHNCLVHAVARTRFG